MNRWTFKRLAPTLATVTAISAFGVGVPAAAGAAPSTALVRATAAVCRAETVKPRVHTEAARREATLVSLAARLQQRRDPFGLNGAQVTALQGAKGAIAGIDARIAATCYPTLAAFKADADPIFVDYRVYWLRVPQTSVIEAADWLAEARVHLAKAAARLAPLVGSKPAAQADYTAMTQALSAADARLGTPPAPAPDITVVAQLQPARDMSSDTAALRATHADLLAVQSSLDAARAAGVKVVGDLHA